METDPARVSAIQKGRPGSAGECVIQIMYKIHTSQNLHPSLDPLFFATSGHSSDDASTSSGPAIHMASIEGNKRATNKVESWLRKASQKKVRHSNCVKNLVIFALPQPLVTASFI